jgi:glucokinase
VVSIQPKGENAAVYLLAGDIGGTQTRLRLAECVGGICHSLRERHFESLSFPHLSAIIHEFLQDLPVRGIHAVCLGVAGPVQQTVSGQRVKVTNLPWEVDSAVLAREFDFQKVRLINDFEAIGYAIEGLAPQQLQVLQHGEPVPHGPRAVIGAGTGLGAALLVWQGSRYEVIPTEGGHADFGPTDELTIDLARYLLSHFGHSSYELILSGAGLVRLCAFLRDRGMAPESALVTQALREHDPAGITRAALQQEDPLANRTLDLFIQIYGAQAGNMALTAGATGGVYIAGGIAPKIISRLASETFRTAFRNKGNMSSYVARIPVLVVMEPEPGLVGALRIASRL